MNPHTWYVYRWIRKNRFRKKKSLYKQAFQLSFDKTITIYSVVLAVAFLFLFYSWLQRFLPLVEQWQTAAMEWLWLLPSILVIRACGRAFTLPGLKFTSAELKLSRLPHEEKSLLFVVMAEKIVLQTVIPLCLALVVGILTPFSLSFTLGVAVLFVFFSILTNIIQWKLFSINKWWKLAVMGSVLAGILGLRFLTLYLDLPETVLGIVLFTGLAAAQFLFIPKAAEDIDWMKVVEVNDAKVWNIPLLGQITRVRIRPPRKYGLVQTYIRNHRSKKRYSQIQPLYHRLWRKHLQISIEYVGRTLLACIALVAVLPFKENWMIYISLPLAAFVYVQVAAGIFTNHFQQEPLFMAIPIDQKNWESTFVKWAVAGLAPLYVSFLVYGLWVSREGWGFIIQFAGFLAFTIFELKVEIRTALKKLMREHFMKYDWLRVTGYGVLVTGMFFTPIMLVFPVGLLVAWKRYFNTQALKG